MTLANTLSVIRQGCPGDMGPLVINPPGRGATHEAVFEDADAGFGLCTAVLKAYIGGVAHLAVQFARVAGKCDVFDLKIFKAVAVRAAVEAAVSDDGADRALALNVNHAVHRRHQRFRIGNDTVTGNIPIHDDQLLRGHPFQPGWRWTMA